MAERSQGLNKMTESELLLEEFRTIKTMHTESISKISDLCGEVRELVIELRHTQKDQDELKRMVESTQKDVTDLRLVNAGNEPILDIAKSMYRNQMITIGGAVAAVAGTNIPFAKLFGG